MPARDNSRVVWSIPSEVVSRELPSLVVAARIDTDTEPLAVEGSGLAIWRALDGGGTAAEIASRVADLYGIDVTTVRGDVDLFLQELQDAGLAACGELEGS